jgi:hypothetical protein
MITFDKSKVTGFLLGADDMHRIDWKIDGDELISELICLLFFAIDVCLSMFPSLPKKVIVEGTIKIGVK